VISWFQRLLSHSTCSATTRWRRATGTATGRRGTRITAAAVAVGCRGSKPPCFPARAVGLYKLNSLTVTHSLKAPWFQPLSPSCDLLVSKFAFKWNLYRYTASCWTSSSLPSTDSWRVSSGTTGSFGARPRSTPPRPPPPPCELGDDSGR
jgi:hypothetical protein